jgi:hypothetical protein
MPFLSKLRNTLLPPMLNAANITQEPTACFFLLDIRKTIKKKDINNEALKSRKWKRRCISLLLVGP